MVKRVEQVLDADQFLKVAEAEPDVVADSYLIWRWLEDQNVK
jgi:hypothetical protein